MTRLKRGGETGALDTAASIAEFQNQIAILTDMVRQLGGNPRVVAGSVGQADPLTAPFTLYVDPYIGSDRFVGGPYNTFETGTTDEEIIASKLKRMELQRLECGYSSHRPFKTINRAVIEAAIITSKDWYTYSDPKAHVDCVTIVLSGGVHIVYNDPGSSSTSIASWGEQKDPTIEELIAFNPVTGGVLAPRGASLRGQDLRKTTIRPNWVTAVQDELPDYSNRRSILKISGTGFFTEFTGMDKINHTDSCHLLDVFHPASKAELDAFYDKIDSALGGPADLASALLATRPSEYEITGPIDQSEAPSSQWDTVKGASPYIFNVSVRSELGMGGAFWDGAKLEGLRSMVCANFTGTNQQRDMRCWQVYEAGNWVTLANNSTDYQKYIDATPDNVRRNPLRQTRHISAINNAYIQKVSVFGIGQSDSTMVDSGGEITDNTGNSTFGGCSALAKGYKAFAFNKDKNWAVSRIQVPLNLGEKISNIRRIELGVVASVTSSTITLTNGLAIDANSAAVPAILLNQNYSLAGGTRIWVENPNGGDWRATLTASAWSSASPAVINITGALQQSDTNDLAGSDAVGRRVYIRRVVDTRTVSERRASLILGNTASARLPQRDQVLQTDPMRSGGAISREFNAGGEEVLIVTAAGIGPAPGVGVLKTSELTIRRGAPSKVYATSTFYRRGTVVKHANKHWQAKEDMVSAGSSPDPSLWLETYVHMPSDFNPEDVISNEAPILILDTDTSDSDTSTTLGINWTTVWTSAGPIRDQYRTGTDYLGLYGFLRALGFTDSQAHTALLPKAANARQLDPDSPVDFPDAPTGGAATGRGYWALEFRRPSTLRLYNHQWEWAGFGNYSKAMPAVQGDMSPANAFTHYFTNAAGGRVVPKGSNEDGFEVTPKGLEDIATGATVSPEGLGGQTLDEIQRTDFPNGIQVGQTAEVQDLVINGQVTYSNQSLAKTTRPGGIRLANISQMTDTSQSAPNANSNSDLEASPDAVTIQGLNRWRSAQRLLSARAGTQYIYVDPVNGADITNIETLLGAPPTGASTRIKSFTAAVEYANAAFSPNEVVEFRLGPGIYAELATLRFKSVTKIRAWDYTGSGGYLNDSFNGGTVPFDFVNFYDATKQPVFLSRLTAIIQQTPQIFIPLAFPLSFVFEQPAEITGVAWWGTMTTITNTGVPDSFFPGTTANTIAAQSSVAGNWRNLSIADPDNALNYFIRTHASFTAPVSGQFYGIRQVPCMEFLSEAVISNVAIGAQCPADTQMGGNTTNREGLIKISTDKLISVRGLGLVGNVKVSSEVNTGSFSGIRLRAPGDPTGGYTIDRYFLNGHSQRLFMPAARSATISLAFDGFASVAGQAGTYSVDYNTPANNVSLLNTQSPPALATASGNPDATNWKSRGPAFESIFDLFGSFQYPSSARNWTQFWVETNDGQSPDGTNVTGSPGFTGVFGRYQTTVNTWDPNYLASTNIRTTGLSPLAPDTSACVISGFGIYTEDTIFRVAGSGETPENVAGTLDPGEAGAYVNFDPLNIRVRTIAKGVDIANAMTALRTVTL